METPQFTEHVAFNTFVAEHLGDDLGGRSLEDAVSEFRAYQREVEELRAKLAVAVEQSDRGESEELDDEHFWAQIDAQLDAKGIPE
jgi:hypothetical protein